VKFGILYNTDYHAEAHGTASQYYSDILTQVELEEALGYDAVWFGEHHYSGYSFGSPPVIAMAAAARTKRIRLGTGVSLIPLNHPIRLAEEYAMLDVLSGGRLEYGIGRGFLKYSHEVMGVSEDENQGRYQEGTDIIVKAWTADGPFDYDGKFWQLKDYSFFPKPLQQPFPPIYASAVITPESAIWAGKHGFHLSTGFFVPQQARVREVIGIYRKSLLEHGHRLEDREVSGVFQMYCAPTQAQAVAEGTQYAINYFKFFGALDARAAHNSKDFEKHGKGISRAFAKGPTEGFDPARQFIIGDPAFCIDMIQWAQEYYGTNYLIFEVAQGGEPHELVMKSLKLFAEKVMPAFK
jgi:alkanesulfonate monooxygenase SsuD/methylene tetrahydromethanopterin reductase-like flavin-dependent oxidoreductase (luciferase family)